MDMDIGVRNWREILAWGVDELRGGGVVCKVCNTCRFSTWFFHLVVKFGSRCLLVVGERRNASWCWGRSDPGFAR